MPIYTEKIPQYMNTYVQHSTVRDAEYVGVSKLRLLCERCINLGFVGNQHVSMPDGKSYNLYQLAKCTLPSKPDVSDWERLVGTYGNSAYLTGKQLDLMIFSDKGLIKYRNEIFIKNHPYLKDALLVAVPVEQIDDETLYIRHHKDLGHQLRDLVCYRIDNVTKITYAWNVLNLLRAESGETVVYINGRHSIVESSSDIKLGDLVEFVRDPNIIGVVNASDLVSYRDASGHYKYLIHVPKTMNPNNNLITSHTCDCYINPVNSLASDNKLYGVYIHSVGSDGDDIKQITHNDFGIKESYISQFLDVIESTEYEFYVYVRKDSNDKTVIRENNFIRELYLNDDDTIVNFLTGHGAANLSFWSAAELEQSIYVDLLSRQFPIIFDENNVDTFIDSLGAYNVAGIICDKITYGKAGAQFSVGVPYGMYSCDSVKAHSYVNGLYVDNTVFRRNNSIIVQLDESDYSVGDDVVIELYEPGSDQRGEFFTPALDADTLDVSAREVYVYEVATPSGDSIDPLIDELDIEKIYKPFTGFSTDGDNIVFSSDDYGKEFLVTTKNIDAYTSVEITEIAPTPLRSGILTATLQNFSSDDVITVPVLTGSSRVWLNGYTLVEGIDMSVTSLDYPDGFTAGNIIHVSNISYLNESGEQSIKIISNQEINLASVNSIAIDDEVKGIIGRIAHLENIAIVSCDGKVGPASSTNLLEVAESVRTGAIVGIQAYVPNDIGEYLKSIDDDSDARLLYNDRVNLVSEYFASVEEDEGTVIIEHSHDIYSIVCSYIWRDIAENSANLSNGTLTDIARQLEPYMPLAKYDPVMSGILTGIRVVGCSNATCVDSYRIASATVTDKDRVWNGINCTIAYDNVGKRWVLKNTESNVVHYYAPDLEGTWDPWKLVWLATEDDDTPPTLISGSVNTDFIDIFPHYNKGAEFTTATYKLMQSIMKVLLPEDEVTEEE